MPSGSTPSSITTADSPSAPAAPASPAPGSLTAAQVVAKFKAAGLPIGAVTVYTAADDPDHLLGTRNGYLSKAAFVDKQVLAAQAAGQGPVGAGGEVEVFATSAEATARKMYIFSAETTGQMLGTEYDLVDGVVLLRLSEDLTVAQAEAFPIALG
jgi:hypothetical protein